MTGERDAKELTLSDSATDLPATLLLEVLERDLENWHCFFSGFKGRRLWENQENKERRQSSRSWSLDVLLREIDI